MICFDTQTDRQTDWPKSAQTGMFVERLRGSVTLIISKVGRASTTHVATWMAEFSSSQERGGEEGGTTEDCVKTPADVETVKNTTAALYSWKGRDFP